MFTDVKNSGIFESGTGDYLVDVLLSWDFYWICFGLESWSIPLDLVSLTVMGVRVKQRVPILVCHIETEDIRLNLKGLINIGFSA